MQGAVKNSDNREASGVQARLAPMVLARTLFAYRQAAKDQWGNEGLAAITAEISEDARESLQLRDDDGWLPESYVVQFCEAMWNGPAARDERSFREVCGRMVDLGFGRARKLLLSVATPHGLLRRAGDLWREELSNGRLVAYGTGDTAGVLTLHDHRWTESPVMRLALSESFRHAVSLTGAKGVVDRHAQNDSGALVVHLVWR